MESVESLENSIELYKTQLSQITNAIEASTSGSEKSNLISLQENITELLHLTQESLKSLKDAKNENDVAEKPPDDDPFAKEYELFKAELGDLMTEDSSKDKDNEGTNTDLETVSESNNESNEDAVCLQDELEALLGSKCQAPFYNKYYSKSYHNALICGVETSDSETSLDAVKVRVLFINPIERDMVTCPYFLDDKCTYGEEKCNFSHGYSVPFENLREYKEPDFSQLKKGRAVLAKVSGSRVWKSTVIEEIVSDEEVVVRHEGTSVHVPLHDVFPLIHSGDGSSDLSSESDLEDDIEDVRGGLTSQQEAIVEMTLTRHQPPGQKPLGHWEQFTKGIGSKLMAKMGYVAGSGLGKNGEGRLTPVEATVLPAGKSLDHCMELKEAAGGSKDLFSAEKIQKKLSLQAIRRSKRAYFREKYKEKNNVFNFINTNLNSVSASPSTSKSKVKEELALSEKLSKTTGRDLNVERFKIAEDIRESQKRIYVLSESLTRQESGSIPHKNILGRLESERGKLTSLRNMDHKVEREQSLRKTKRKMTVF